MKAASDDVKSDVEEEADSKEDGTPSFRRREDKVVEDEGAEMLFRKRAPREDTENWWLIILCPPVVNGACVEAAVRGRIRGFTTVGGGMGNFEWIDSGVGKLVKEDEEEEEDDENGEFDWALKNCCL